MPSTNKSPLILTIPVLSPTTPGSIIKLDGPAIVAVNPIPLETDTPIAIVCNLSESECFSKVDPVTTKLLAVSAVDTFTSSSSVCPSTSNPALRSTSEANVAIPTTFNVSLMLVISSSVVPSTSKSPLASMLLVNVAVSATLRTSNSVIPSTSRLPLASIFPVKVDTPETSSVENVAIPAAGFAPLAPVYLYPMRYTLDVVIPDGTFVPLKLRMPEE